MRILPAVLLCLLGTAASLHAQAATPASFAGRWTLDRAKSRDLPPFYAGLREHRLDVAQDDSTVSVAVALVDTAGVEQRMQFPYDLRRPTRVTTQVRTQAGPRDIPTTLTATRQPDGTLAIDIARELRLGDRVVTPRDQERWQLSADGTQLLIDREAEMPGPDGMRTIRTRYVFVRG